MFLYCQLGNDACFGDVFETSAGLFVIMLQYTINTSTSESS
jgi:hypothetical protein